MQLDIKPEVLAEVKVEQSEAQSGKSHREPSEKDRRERHKDENRQKGRSVFSLFEATFSESSRSRSCKSRKVSSVPFQ